MIIQQWFGPIIGLILHILAFQFTGNSYQVWSKDVLVMAFVPTTDLL